MPRDTFEDIAAILNPMPEPDDLARGGDDGYDAAVDACITERQLMVEQMRLAWDEGDVDPLLSAVAAARRARERAETEIRQLLAYGREFASPRPYTLADLAEAAGMSISGTRTAYSDHDIQAVAHETGGRPQQRRSQA
jgi:hypothetical protein